MNISSGSKVVVGMSGGVDSSVAAALLKNQGYDVIGVMLRLWSENEVENRCCAPDAQIEARRIAAQLEIPFYVVDAQNVFYQEVVQPFIAGYGAGITPNPCLNCNRHIRWEFLLSKAKALGADLIATGHYAQIKVDTRGKYQLHKNPDTDKDQTYFLHVLTQDQLSQTKFPLAEYTKDQVRRLARDMKLSAAERPDSQDLCFVGSSDYRTFLSKQNPSLFRPGKIISQSGKILGEHTGLANYTIGQRKGLRVAGPEPYYVINKDLVENQLVIGVKSELGRKNFAVNRTNWISGEAPEKEITANIKIRYRAKAVPGRITPLSHENVSISLNSALPDITPGQAAVFYDGDICLGGGIIQEETT
jgi:tRNA-specific 2-thiouridylase